MTAAPTIGERRAGAGELATALAPARAAKSPPWGFLEFFVVLQVLAPAVLFLPGTQPLRVPIRMLPFAASIAGLMFLFGPRRPTRAHPASLWVLAALAYLSLMVLHPQTNTLLAGLAQVGVYAAVMAPLLWVPHLVRDERQVARLLALTLACNGLNAAVGVLQVTDPDRWLPEEFSTVAAGEFGPLMYTDDYGNPIIRPPGLSDSPGAVCGPATTAALLGFVALTLRVPWWVKSVSLGFAGLGVTAILLSHVRTNLLILVGMITCYLIVLVLQREYRRAGTLAAAAGGIVVLGFGLATALGGRSVPDRFATLLEEDPFTIYYYRSARGYMTHYDTLRYLHEAPLGAGLGRWGMMRVYFGDPDNPRSPPRWAEVQFTAWALDGGVVLIIAYAGAIAAATWSQLRIALHARDPRIRRMGAIVLAHNLGIAALVLSYTPFVAQVGIMYWFMAGLLHGIVMRQNEAVAA